MKNYNDEQLVKLAKQGQEEAMNALLSNYKSQINKIARKYFLIGGDMEDIVQEGMIGLYKSIIHFDENKNASFKTFATTCIKHQIQSAIKIASNETNMLLSQALPITEDHNKDDEEEDIEILLPSPLPSPDDEVLANEKHDEFNQFINKNLTALEKKILSLYLKGYSYNEISSMADISKKSIDNGLSRIKNKLSTLKNEIE